MGWFQEWLWDAFEATSSLLRNRLFQFSSSKEDKKRGARRRKRGFSSSFPFFLTVVSFKWEEIVSLHLSPHLFVFSSYSWLLPTGMWTKAAKEFFVFVWFSSPLHPTIPNIIIFIVKNHPFFKDPWNPPAAPKIKMMIQRRTLLFYLIQWFLSLELISHHHHQLLTSAFNVDVDTALIHRGPPGTYFGFSVAQHKDGRASWLLVGAPLAQTDQPSVEKGGAVYKCSPDVTNVCQQISFDLTSSASINIRGKQEQVDEKSYQWFGSTLYSSGKSGMIVACAPRYVYFSVNRKRRDPVGTCYVSRGSFTGFMEYSPCRTPSWGYHRQGSCQAGFSAALTPDGKRLFIGAPGSWYWQGQLFSQDLVSTPRLPDGDKESPLGTRESPEYEDDTYLGYALTVGRFSANPDDVDLDVAVGVPKGMNLTGKVSSSQFIFIIHTCHTPFFLFLRRESSNFSFVESMHTS